MSAAAASSDISTNSTSRYSATTESEEKHLEHGVQEFNCERNSKFVGQCYLAASRALQSSEWREVSIAGLGRSVVGLVCKTVMARRSGDTASIGFSRRIWKTAF